MQSQDGRWSPVSRCCRFCCLLSQAASCMSEGLGWWRSTTGDVRSCCSLSFDLKPRAQKGLLFQLVPSRYSPFNPVFPPLSLSLSHSLPTSTTLHLSSFFLYRRVHSNKLRPRHIHFDPTLVQHTPDLVYQPGRQSVSKTKSNSSVNIAHDRCDVF